VAALSSEGGHCETAAADGRLHVFVPVFGRHTRLELAYRQVRPL